LWLLKFIVKLFYLGLHNYRLDSFGRCAVDKYVKLILCVYVSAFINTLMKGIRLSVWIGINNLLHQKHFVWSDNSYFHFTNWAPGEPNGHSTDTYLHGLSNVVSNLNLFKWSP